MSKIDLSFLKHKELPTKVITVEINGKSQTFDIKPINGRGLTSLGLIQEDDLDRSSKLCILALMYGLDLKQSEAELFVNSDLVAADTIAAHILEFTREYSDKIIKAKEEVKKNTKVK